MFDHSLRPRSDEKLFYWLQRSGQHIIRNRPEMLFPYTSILGGLESANALAAILDLSPSAIRSFGVRRPKRNPTAIKKAYLIAIWAAVTESHFQDLVGKSDVATLCEVVGIPPETVRKELDLSMDMWRSARQKRPAWFRRAAEYIILGEHPYPVCFDELDWRRGR